MPARDRPVDGAGRTVEHLRGAGVAVDGQHADGVRLELVGVLLAGGDGDVLRGGQALHAQVRALGGEFAAGKTGGIAAVVIEPELHVALLGLLDQNLHGVKIAGRKVGGFAAARLDESRLDIHRFGAVEHGPDVLAGARVAEAAVELRAVFRRRRGEIGGELGGGGIGDLLPGPLLG